MRPITPGSVRRYEPVPLAEQGMGAKPLGRTRRPLDLYCEALDAGLSAKLAVMSPWLRPMEFQRFGILVCYAPKLLTN